MSQYEAVRYEQIVADDIILSATRVLDDESRLMFYGSNREGHVHDQILVLLLLVVKVVYYLVATEFTIDANVQRILLLL